VEAHILAEVAELYGRPLSLEFMHYLRPQEQFDSPEELCRQMDKDVQHVKERLA
jgi:riboflavin kinase/FMN adenylyltransferase